MIPSLMGIVNVTPDSFSDGGKFFAEDAAIRHGLDLLEEGAQLLDVGGESTRPGAEEIPEQEEIRRIVPVIRELSRHGAVSVDTWKPAVLEAALDAGARFINDITALSDPACLTLAAQARVPVCLMHMQGNPRTMQVNPSYRDVVEEVFAYLAGRIEACCAAGIGRDLLYADIGIGFGKTLDHNLALLRHLSRFHDLGVKLLLGASRKSFIARLDRDEGADRRMPGSIAAALWGASQGVHMLRVHDVAATRQALAVWDGISGSGSSAGFQTTSQR